MLGTTVVLNTMLEFDGAVTGLITNSGFRDVIELRRGHKESQVDLRLSAPIPIVPRRLRRTVAGRVDYTGLVVQELDEDEVRREVAVLRDAGVESIAVCLALLTRIPRMSVASPRSSARCTPTAS